ncbi:hypothetical protein [Streptomyces nigra]|uniref:hypothetical protein n=1 Tax=Streptomyces nigra TaxID=1827580 RepID=UPI003821D0E5
MTRRRTQISVYALLSSGIGGGILGITTDIDDVTFAGLFAMAAGVGLMVCRNLRITAYANETRLAEAHNAGYVLALEHVALGLLDREAAPPEGPGTTAPNVVFLRHVRGDHNWKQERKAQ